ncbi:MAG: DUF1616 domain-containing protein [Candidatus Bathyarchaeales archaeon]
MTANVPAELTNAIIQIIKENKPQSTRQLILLVQEKFSLPEEQIVKAIVTLQEQGKITFVIAPKQPPLNLAAYLKTNSALWYWITIAAASITTILVFAVPENAYPISYLRNIFGAIFVLWLPGYAFIKALFPASTPLKTSSESLDRIERVALSLGMSLALVPIVGLILNYTPWGIRLAPVTLSLLALTAVFATAAVIREHQTKLRSALTA